MGEATRAALRDPAAFSWACVSPAGATRAPEVEAPRERVSRQALTDLLTGAIRRIGGEGPVDVALSGGLDSAGLAALASAAGLRPRCWTFSVESGGDPEEMAELARARLTARRLKLEQVVVPVRDDDLPDDFAAATLAMGAPVYNPRAVSRYRFWRAVAQGGGKRVLSGVGADEILLGEPAKLATSNGWPVFLARRLPECVLGETLLRLVPPGEPPRPPRIDGLRAAQRMQRGTELPLATLPVECGPARAQGIELGLPYLDADLVRWADALPVRVLVRRGVGKLPLRRALRGLIPEEVRCLPKTPHLTKPKARSAVQQRRWLELLRELLTVERLELLQAVEPRRVRELLERHARGDPAVADFETADRVLLRLASLTILAAAGP